MEETDEEMMSEDIDSDNETWAGPIPGPDERMEQCKLGKKTLNLPELFLEKNHIFMSVLSMDTWDTVLSDENRSYLEKFLPNFPENDKERKRETVKMLLGGEDFKFGNPMKQLQKNLKEGYLHPEIARYKKQTRQFRIRDYKMRQQRRLSDLLKQLLLSRQELFEQAITLAPGEPFKFNYPPPEKKRILHIEEVVKKKTIRILKEVREECGVPDTSSDEDEEMSSPVQRSRKQLFKSLGPIPSPEPTIPSVVATFASKPQLLNGDASLDKVGGDNQSAADLGNHQPSHSISTHTKRPRPISPVEVTEESYKVLLKLHKKKKLAESDLPELDSGSVLLQDILSRCQAKKKNSKAALKETNEGNPATTKKRLKMKAKGEKKGKLKNKDSSSVKEEEPTIPSLKPSGLTLDISTIITGQDEIIEESPIMRTTQSTATNFMCLLRDKLMEFPEMKTSTQKLEEQVHDWLELNDEISNPWLALEKNWLELIPSALKFLSGNELGQTMEGFIPFVDYKERMQQLRWIASGRDSDPELTSVFRFWLQHKDDVNIETHEMVQGSPPPPKAKTNFIVRPTSNNEKALFREQERQRFATPHKAFTFMMHGYDSVVGPVKGVYDKDSGTNKAREHNLLISERPPFVTILTLVRDAAARLPNGEGTRGDICELLKDSQFLAPAVTDSQINAVVSGALDRLHSEKDPCVKYDVNRKLWIYLHRNRTEDEFERIHQAQGAAAKAKKTLTRPKGKAAKEAAANQAVPSTIPTTSLNLIKPTFTLSTLSSPSTKTQAANSVPIPGLGETLTPLEPASILAKSASKSASGSKSAKALASSSAKALASSSSGLTQPTVAQLRAAQAALARSPVTTGKQTIKQLTSGITTASTITNVTSSILTVTSVGLSTTSSLAAQLLYSPRLTAAAKPSSLSSSSLSSPSPLPSSKVVSGASSSLPCVTTFNLVTTMNPSQSAPTATRAVTTPVSTISMLQNQKLLKQQQSASQSMLKQNASLVAAVGQTVAAAANPTVAPGTGKQATGAKQTFSMTAKQVSQSSNNVSQKGQASLVNSKGVPAGLKQTSLILSQEAVANLSASQSSLIAQQGGKLVTLNAGACHGEGAVLIKQPTAVQVSAARGIRPQALKLTGGNLVQPMLGGKPIQLSGKPLAQAKGLVQLAGKGGQSLGVIRTPHGPISTINLIPQSFTTLPGASNTGSGKAATVLAVGSPSPSGQTNQPLAQAAGSLLAAQVTNASNVSILQGSSPGGQQVAAPASQPKVINQTHTGIVVTQLAQGGLALRSGTPVSGTAKMIPGQTNLVPTQFILQQATPTPGTNAQGSVGQNVAAPLIVSNAGGKGQNLQVMRTVLSPHGNLKPGQATILISQPTMAQTVASSPAVASASSQMVQQTSSTKTAGRGSPKGKGQPVYARIITPPPGLKLTNVPVTGSAAGGVNVLQTMGKLFASSKIATHQLPVVTLAMPQAASAIHMASPGGSVSKDDTVAMLVAGTGDNNITTTSLLATKKSDKNGQS